MINKDFYDKYINYFLIGVVSFIALIFLPFIGSEAGLKISIPDTTAGWIVFILTKIIVAVINVLIFHCFVQQAEVRVKDNEKYKEACEILDRIKLKEIVYLSPQEFYRKEYGKKGVTIAITSVLSAFGLAQAVLTWDGLTFLTYLFTIILGLIFGILEMAKVEGYLTTDLWHYALRAQEAQNLALSSDKSEDTTNTLPTNKLSIDKEFDSETKEIANGN